MSALAELLFNVLEEFMLREFEEEETKFEVVGKGAQVPTLEGTMQLARGSEYTLPRWIAAGLAVAGHGKIRDDEESSTNIMKILYNEESTAAKLQLSKLRGYFFSRVRERRRVLESSLSQKIDYGLIEEVKRLDDAAKNLARTRLRKVLSLLQLPEVPQEHYEKLSEEERLLLNVMKTFVDRWQKAMVG
ncbi:MAG: hypothetical protein ABWK00_04775 [Desulfurococcaceae archaeon]